MILLELFSGTGSVGKSWLSSKHRVISLDISSKFGAEIIGDVLEWDYKTLKNCPDFIWASTPCEQYSIARSRAKNPRSFQLADAIVNKTWEIIEHYKKVNPALVWFIENPDSSLLWKRFKFTDYVRLDYCQYGTPYRKRTRIATNNIRWIPRALCDSTACPRCENGKHIQTAQQGPSMRGGVRVIFANCSLGQLHCLPQGLNDQIQRPSRMFACTI